MRKEPFGVGSFVHIFNRGNRKQEIVRDAKDCWHFLQMLYYFNNESCLPNPFRDLRILLKSSFNSRFVWPESWPPRKPLTKIIAFALMKNHYHLLLKEIQDGGISTFMQRLGTGMTKHFNQKYQEVGRLFQGSYRAKAIPEDVYLKYVHVYIQVKNPFELYSGGIRNAADNFMDAYEIASNYPYCSLGDYAGKRKSPIIDKDIFENLFKTNEDYRKFAQECILGMNLEEAIENFIFTK